MNSFYDIKGNEISKDNIVSEFIANYSGKLTDFNEGSEIRNLLEAFAVYAMGLEERLNDSVYVMDIMNADGEYLDLLAGQPGIDMERDDGNEASGEVLFTLAEPLSEELLIPAETVVTSRDGVDFLTVTDNVIPAGVQSVSCMVEAVDVGTDGNISAHGLLNSEDDYELIYGCDVDNPEPFSGGRDFEEDDMFRDRILAVMGNAKFGSKPYYISMLMSEFTEAHDILFETGTGEFAAVVTPNTYAGSDAQAKLEMDVASWLADDNNVMLGHRFNVVAPVEKTLNVHIQNSRPSTESYLWFQGIRQEDVEKVKELIRIYFYGGSSSYVAYECQGLNIGEEVTAEDMRSLLKEVFDMTEFVGAMNEKLGDADVYRLVFP